MSQHRFSLSGSIALVIGGTSGIGRAIALGFARAGATVLPASRAKDKVEAAIAALAACGSNGSGYAVDANDLEALSATVDKVLSDWGRIDILVNSQGMTILKAAVDFTADDYDAVMNTNLRSVFFACTKVGSHMVGRNQGAIVNIASLASFRGWGRSALYAMSKSGVVSLTQTLGREWAQHGVRVNAIAPGFFMTNLNESKMSEARKTDALQRTPMGRFGVLEEVVGAAIYLASPAAEFVTGATLPVDGGYLAMGI